MRSMFFANRANWVNFQLFYNLKDVWRLDRLDREQVKHATLLSSVKNVSISFRTENVKLPRGR